MKPRPPLTIESALDRAAGLIGYAGIAKATGKSESLCRKWADPDCEQQINAKQMLAVDAACMEASGEAPLYEVQERIIGARRGIRKIRELREAMLDAQARFGRLCGAVLDGRSHEVGSLAADMRPVLDDLERSAAAE